MRRVEVVDDQKHPGTVLREPAQVEFVERSDVRAIHRQRVAEADRRDRIHEVAGINGINADEPVGVRGESGGERCFAACAFAADEERRLRAVKIPPDLLQFPLAAKEQGRNGRERCGRDGGSGGGLGFFDADAEELDGGRRDQAAEVLAAVAEERGEDQPGERCAQVAAQGVRVRAVVPRRLVLVQAGADVHEDVIPVLRIHLRRQPLLLVGAGLEEPPDLLAERVHRRAAVRAAEVAHEIDIGLDHAVHRGRRDRGGGPVHYAVHDKRFVKKVPVPGHRIPLLFAAEQVAAALGVSFDIIHQKVPAAEMQVQEIVPLVVGTACFGHDVFHEVKACLGEPAGRMVPGRQFLLRGGPAHENTVSLICIEPRFDGGKGEYISVVHNCTCLRSCDRSAAAAAR